MLSLSTPPDGLWFGRVKVEADDEELTDSQHWWLGPKKYQFSVGDSEPHKVELRIGTLGTPRRGIPTMLPG